MGKDGAGAVSWVETEWAAGRMAKVSEIGQCPEVELPGFSPDWKLGRGREEAPQGHANVMRCLEDISDKGVEETVGLRWTASEARTRRASYFRSCFGDTAVGRGSEEASIRRVEAHFCSSNSEHAPLDDNKLILIKQVGVSDCSKEGPCKA